MVGAKVALQVGGARGGASVFGSGLRFSLRGEREGDTKPPAQVGGSVAELAALGVSQKEGRQDTLPALGLCGRGDSNPHGLTPTRP